MSARRWTHWELSVLRAEYRRCGAERCALMMNTHTPAAVRIKARELGLTRPRCVLNERAVRVMRQLYYVGRLGYADLCRMFGASWSAVWNAVNGTTWSHVK